MNEKSNTQACSSAFPPSSPIPLSPRSSGGRGVSGRCGPHDLVRLGICRALVVHSYGLDEISPMGQSVHPMGQSVHPMGQSASLEPPPPLPPLFHSLACLSPLLSLSPFVPLPFCPSPPFVPLPLCPSPSPVPLCPSSLFPLSPSSHPVPFPPLSLFPLLSLSLLVSRFPPIPFFPLSLIPLSPLVPLLHCSSPPLFHVSLCPSLRASLTSPTDVLEPLTSCSRFPRSHIRHLSLFPLSSLLASLNRLPQTLLPFEPRVCGNRAGSVWGG
ncbi:unnamed protein product [Closterium sp. NIES-65]|nr:unnamed protein product [Closterium sp. NIES-65]